MRMIIIDRQGLQEFIRRISQIVLDGKKRFIAEFKIYRIKRTIPQNRLYWMWLRCIHAETGNDPEDLHEYFKGRYGMFNLKPMFGDQVKIPVHTPDMDTKEFSDYLEKIRVQMIEEGVYLPQPGEHGWAEFYAQYGIK